MKGKNFLICFTGIDGSGKTTHAKCLMIYLKQNGYSCIYVWGAFRPILSYFLFVFTRLIGYWKEVKKNAYTNPLENAPEKFAEKFGFLLHFLYFIDFQMKALFKIRLPLMLGKSVVCDRYFYDMLMELDRSNLSSKKFIKLISKTLPRPSITFLLDVPEDLAGNRRGFPSMDLKSKRRIFLKMGKIFNFVIINASDDFLSNQKRIRGTVLAHINMNCGV